MPEYLSRGVFIEEMPPRLRAIEGVSTSTAGFVGDAERGPVPGFGLPFTPNPGTDPQAVTLVATPTPVLVTSFAQFTREFGRALPLPDPDNNAYLAYSVRAFFDNGGKRAYISRVLNFDPQNPATAGNPAFSAVSVRQGTVLRLTRSARVGDTQLQLNSLRGVGVGADTLSVRRRSGAAVPLPLNITAYNSNNKTVALDAALTVDLYASRLIWRREPGHGADGLDGVGVDCVQGSIAVGE